MRHPAAVAALLQLLLPLASARPLDAQPNPYYGEVRAGHLVRVRHGDPCCRSPRTGTLVSIDTGSVVLHASGSQTRTTISRRSVQHMERGFQIGTHARSGAKAGALIGFAAGAAVVVAHLDECEDICIWPLGVAYFGTIGGLTGLGVGWVIGRMITREEWVRVPLPARVGLGPSRSGQIALGFTLPF